MRNISIRAKVTILFVTLFLIISSTFSLFMYIYLSNILYRAEKNTIEEEIDEQLANLSDNTGDISQNFDSIELLSASTEIYIFDSIGSVKYSSRDSDITRLPFEATRFREFYDNQQDTLLFHDEPFYYDDQIAGWIRVARPVSHIKDTLCNIRTVIFTATPIYLLFATLSSMFLTSRALSPIDTITKTANIIEKGDLSKRITLPKVNDEVGRLARTFNKMIERIDKLFKKEKRFTSDASHELMTPISVISGTAEEALKDKAGAVEYRKALKSIINESKNLSYLISQLLFLARSDEGKEALDLEDIDLNLVIDSVVKQLEEKASKKNIRIFIDLKQDFKLKADQTLMTMLFLNIMENSIKYNKYGGMVNISLLKKENEVSIIFEDNGIGISAEDLPYIFDRFYQVSKSRTGKGSGLGLAITREIVELHKGRIKIYSEFGKGTRVEIALPLT